MRSNTHHRHRGAGAAGEDGESSPARFADPALERVFQQIESWDAVVGTLPVAPDVTPAEIRAHLARYDFAAPVPADELVDDAVHMLRRWSLQIHHPRYFGLFNPGVRRAGVIADSLVALHNPQLATWSHSPAGNEIERHVLSFVMRRFGFDPDAGFANFTSGGHEANLTATIAALTATFPAFGSDGTRGIIGGPTLYLSAEAHHSFIKIAHMTGIGRKAIRVIPTDSRLRMDVGALAQQIADDRARGHQPFMIVATAGTTALGAIDPIPEIAEIARKTATWLHVDAAWGGAAVLSEALRVHLAGIERADSITCDAHKWFSVPVAAGMFFSRHRAPVLDAFRVAASYVPPAVPGTFDPYTTTAQWSRRLIGLKVFFTLAELGVNGLAAIIEYQAAMANRIRSELTLRGWHIINDSPLAIVGFTHPLIVRGVVTCTGVVNAVVGRGRAWISEVRLPDGSAALRACVCSHLTRPEDVQVLAEELSAALATGSSVSL